MANTYTKISSFTYTTASQAQYMTSFTSIPSTYTDLCIRYSARSTYTGGNADTVYMIFNGDSGSNYNYNISYYDTSSGSFTGSSGTAMHAGYAPSGSTPITYFGVGEIYIYNYATTTTFYKNAKYNYGGTGNASTYQYAIEALGAGTWSNTSAISSLRLGITSGYTFLAGSVFTLYGIKNS